MKIIFSDANGADEAKEYIKYIHSRVPNLEFLCIKRHCAYEAVQGIIKDINKVVSYSCFCTVVFGHTHVK